MRAERRSPRQNGDEVLVDDVRMAGLPGSSSWVTILDAGKLSENYDHGVLV